jgi:hypothetical protein
VIQQKYHTFYEVWYFRSEYHCTLFRPGIPTASGVRKSQQALHCALITHGHCPQGNRISSLLGADVLPVWSTAFTTNTFSQSGEA